MKKAPAATGQPKKAPAATGHVPPGSGPSHIIYGIHVSMTYIRTFGPVPPFSSPVRSSIRTSTAHNMQGCQPCVTSCKPCITSCNLSYRLSSAGVGYDSWITRSVFHFATTVSPRIDHDYLLTTQAWVSDTLPQALVRILLLPPQG